ncbi:MAG TPA: SUMF1/EgtB/PvdO family nonheme iron enzyme [Prolixibacteraceae bacterium]|nr:SUMF1/EgtB/PvdO family nonheme iron enzyme [Prolixibacteraceae bacterium]
MRKLLWLVLIAFLLVTSCRKSDIYNAEEIRNRGMWFEPTPYGMVYIQRDAFQLGPSDDEIHEDQRRVNVSVDAFWIDDTEITNNEYMQFVVWVRDSIARKLLGAADPEFLRTEDAEGVPLDPPLIDWKPRINWQDPDVRMALNELYIPEEERFSGRPEIDSRKLIYDYYWIDFRQAARRANSFNYDTQRYEGTVLNSQGEEVPVENRSAFIMHERVPVYPDTLCWVRDFSYSYNEPQTYKYFSHPAFFEYPVVGVSWDQARAFCNWRTRLNESYRSRLNDTPAHDYRLPTESEWELAARGGRENTKFPWGSYYARNQQGCFVANFKPLRGNYVADSESRVTTTRTGSFDPNDFGLYDMSGNVAEWTSSAYFEAGYDLINDMNPEIDYHALPDDPPVMKRKVVRGGSWKDTEYFIRTSTRSYEYQDTTKSYIGFRCVRSSFRNELQGR